MIQVYISTTVPPWILKIGKCPAFLHVPLCSIVHPFYSLASALTSPTRTSSITPTRRPTSPPKSALPTLMVDPSLRRRVARNAAHSLRKRTVRSRPVTISMAPFGRPLSRTQSSRNKTAAPLTFVTGSATHSRTSTRPQGTSHVTPQRRSSTLLHVRQPTSNFTRRARRALPVASDATLPRAFYAEE